MAFMDRAKELYAAPPHGAPYSVAVPNSEKPGRSAMYRHWRFKDGVLKSLDPNISTAHDMFESAAKVHPRQPCLGWRPYDSNKKTWGAYQWIDYETVQRRRANLGVGIVKVIRDAGVLESSYGVGLWCQNRPEWQISGMSIAAATVSAAWDMLTR